MADLLLALHRLHARVVAASIQKAVALGEDKVALVVL
jgi:hypothetical protein